MPQTPSRDAEELVTVVIPARNEEGFIRECLQSVRVQSYRNLQIVVVDGASDDRTPHIVKEIAEQDPRVELLVNPERVIPRSLNVALAAARGVWLVRIDAHCTVPEDYVRRAVDHLRTGSWAGVGGRKDGRGVTPAGRAVAAAMGSRFGVGNSTYHYGESVQEVDHVPFGSYPVALVRELGGWDEALTVNQDFEFDHRVRLAGGRLLFDPALRIDWHCRQSVPGLFRQYRRYGRGKVPTVRLHPDSLRARHLVAPALVAWGAGAVVVALRRPAVAAGMVAPYAFGVAAASVVTGRRLDGRARALVPVAFVAMHVGWGLGFWEGLLAGVAAPEATHHDAPARRTDVPHGR